MNITNLASLIKVRLLVVMVALGLGLIFISALFISIFNPPQPPKATPSPLPRIPDKQGVPVIIPDIVLKDQPTLSNYSEIAIGETLASDIEKLPGLVETKTLASGVKQFYFTSTDALRNNLVETEDDKAVFKRVVSVTTADYQTPNINTYTQSYGNPESEFTGSKRYGPYMKTYVYPSKGFALIFNPYTEEVFEIQSFKPVSFEEYRSRWGEDIKEETQIPETEKDKVY